MLRNFIVLTCLFTAVLSGQVLKPAAVSEPADYEFIVLAGESIELSVEQKEGFKYEWNDGGAGKLEPILGTGKARWTAPNTPGKENPVNIKILAVSERNIAAEKNTIVKKVAVLGGDIASQPVLFYCDGPGPARLFKSAANQARGVKYQWEIVRGTENLNLLPEDINRAEAKFKAKKPSAKKDDVEIKLTYTLGTGKEKKTCEYVKRFYVMMPVSLKKISRENVLEEGPDLYGFATTTKYRVMDQFGEPLMAEGIVITQDITLVSNPNGISAKAIKVDFGQYVTDFEGVIGSRRYISSVFPLPANFLTLYEQDLFINGSCLLEKLDITYTKNGVEEVSNKDRLTRRQRLEKSKSKNDPNKVIVPK